MVKEVFDNDSNLIKISELLDLFHLNLNLSKQVLNLYVDACLKESNLFIKEDHYTFKFDDYSVTINPSNDNNTLIEYQEVNLSEKLPGSICCYNSEGAVIYIT